MSDDKADKEIIDEGELLFICAPLPGGAPAHEERVQALAKETGERLDWHYAAGRVCIYALCRTPADYSRVMTAARVKWPRWTTGYTQNLETDL